MRVYVDTEFSDLIHPVLISVGLAAEDGRELYLELAEGEGEYGWTGSMCSDFVRAAVLPQLDSRYAYLRSQCARRIRAFLAESGPDVEVIVDYALDAELVQELLADEGISVPGVRWSRIELGGLGQLVQERRLAASRRHHALDDAIALREGAIAEERGREKKG